VINIWPFQKKKEITTQERKSTETKTHQIRFRRVIKTTLVPKIARILSIDFVDGTSKKHVLDHCTPSHLYGGLHMYERVSLVTGKKLADPFTSLDFQENGEPHEVLNKYRKEPPPVIISSPSTQDGLLVFKSDDRDFSYNIQQVKSTDLGPEYLTESTLEYKYEDIEPIATELT
jgi:hypothetical protein